MQQGLGPDVVVEERSGASDLRQAEPQPQEHGLVSHEHRHRVALLQAAALHEHSGGLVAERVRVPVRERLILET